MSALLPVLLLGSQFILVADPVPRLDANVSCRSAGATSVMGPGSGTRSVQACEQDEKDARNKLEQEWSQFSAAEQAHCTRLTTLWRQPELCRTAHLPGNGQGRREASRGRPDERRQDFSR